LPDTLMVMELTRLGSELRTGLTGTLGVTMLVDVALLLAGAGASLLLGTKERPAAVTRLSEGVVAGD
jgi:hypothetical protein